MKRTTVVCGLVLCVAGSVASAQGLLQLDIDALSARAIGTPFDENFTGDLRIFNTAAEPDVDGDAKILDVLIDGTRQFTGGADAPEFSFLLEIAFLNGDIVSGGLSVSHDQTGSENTYVATLSPGVNSILDIGGGSFILGGLTFGGLWNNPAGTFLGVDISPWGSVQPVDGFFANIAFEPDANNFDSDVDVDVFQIPAPGTLALVGLGGLAAARRRR